MKPNSTTISHHTKNAVYTIDYKLNTSHHIFHLHDGASALLSPHAKGNLSVCVFPFLKNARTQILKRNGKLNIIQQQWPAEALGGTVQQL